MLAAVLSACLAMLSSELLGQLQSGPGQKVAMCLVEPATLRTLRRTGKTAVKAWICRMSASLPRGRVSCLAIWCMLKPLRHINRED